MTLGISHDRQVKAGLKYDELKCSGGRSSGERWLCGCTVDLRNGKFGTAFSGAATDQKIKRERYGQNEGRLLVT
jgi:hypothetical protein